MTENVQKMCFIVIFKIHIHIFMGTIGLLILKNICIDITIVTLVIMEPKL